MQLPLLSSSQAQTRSAIIGCCVVVCDVMGYPVVRVLYSECANLEQIPCCCNPQEL